MVELAYARTGFVALRSDGNLVMADACSTFDVPVGVRAIAVAGGYPTHTTIINPDRTVTTWGEDFYGDLSPPPRLRNIIAVAAGAGFTVAIKLPSPPQPALATATAQVVNGFVVGINVVDGGEGYAVAPGVRIVGGNGTGATATAQITRGVVTGVTITNAGIGYTGTPTVEIDPPPFLPRLDIAPSRVGVTMHVLPGRRYQLEASNDLPNFAPVGAPFIAEGDTHWQEFSLTETGQFYRIQEVP